MEPLEVFALDKDRNRASGPIGYKSLQWGRKYYEPGSFMLEVASDRYDESWAYVCADGRPECGIVQKVEYADDSEVTDSVDTVMLSGFFMEDMLNWRTFLAEDEATAWKRTGYADFAQEHDNIEVCMKSIEVFMADLMTVRKTNVAGERKMLSPSFKRLGEFVFSELRSVGASVRVAYDFESDKIVAYAWRGVDRTQSQDKNPFAVFSDTWGSMHGFSASRDDSNYRNKCYVLYEYEVPKEWSSNGSPKIVPKIEFKETTKTVETTDPETGEVITITTVEYVPEIVGYEIPYTTLRGYHVARISDGQPDKEVYIDNRDKPPEFDDEWERETNSPDEYPKAPAGLKAKYDAWPSVLKNEGMLLLTGDYCSISNLETGTLSERDYMDGWDLGDKVDVLIDAIGMVSEARLIGVTEIYEASGASIQIEIGDELMTYGKKARLL